MLALLAKQAEYPRMANQRISAEKRAFIIGALTEGTPVNACVRMFRVTKPAVLRVIAETGEALARYQSTHFRNLRCARLELDEQWQYCGKHGQRMSPQEKRDNPAKGDFWLWCALDPDSKLVVSQRVSGRKWQDAEDFVSDLSRRVEGPVQITSDALAQYERPIRYYFQREGMSYGTETKVFVDPPTLASWQKSRRNGIQQIAKATREAVIGKPNLQTSTTAHVERLFLSVRQELTRFTRCTLGYSKSLKMHRLSVSLHFGIYNLCRRHTSLGGQTPAQAAGIESSRWSFEDVVKMTDAYWQPILAKRTAEKAQSRRAAEDEAFMAALAELEKP